MQREIEGFHSRPAPETGHIVKGLNCLLYMTTHIAISLHNTAEEVVGEPAIPLGFDSVHDIVDGFEEVGLGELVDEQSVKGLIGFVVLALGIVVQGCED